ncbi:MAG: D-glycero-beta-D-manno-heptose-7-phosphate kinase [Lentisphaeria bacterium]|nr:D-glycero-beta-D-manno-heptose-7-phosphate kinase [Lentisphaeria bacterium]
MRSPAEVVENCASRKIAVAGDLMLDAYTWGKVNRISPEAPVPIVQVSKRTCCLGGGANVMRNLASLGAKTAAFGVVGNDIHGETLRTLLENTSIDSAGVLTDPSRPTTFKERIIAGSQQLLRLDDEKASPIPEEVCIKLYSMLKEYLVRERPDALILEDYAKGLFIREETQKVVDLCNELNIPVTLDPNPKNPLDLKGLTLMKPNRTEAYAMAGIPRTSSSETLETLQNVAQIIRANYDVAHLLISLAEEGMALFQRNGECCVIPTEAKEVYDVSGAGDTVIATVTLGLCETADPVLSARIANCAAGIVVGKLGTAPVGREELLKALNAAK